jgi:hypothetical protein
VGAVGEAETAVAATGLGGASVAAVSSGSVSAQPTVMSTRRIRPDNHKNRCV